MVWYSSWFLEPSCGWLLNRTKRRVAQPMLTNCWPKHNVFGLRTGRGPRRPSGNHRYTNAICFLQGWLIIQLFFKVKTMCLKMSLNEFLAVDFGTKIWGCAKIRPDHLIYHNRSLSRDAILHWSSFFFLSLQKNQTRQCEMPKKSCAFPIQISPFFGGCPIATFEKNLTQLFELWMKLQPKTLASFGIDFLADLSNTPGNQAQLNHDSFPSPNYERFQALDNYGSGKPAPTCRTLWYYLHLGGLLVHWMDQIVPEMIIHFCWYLGLSLDLEARMSFP